MKKSIKLKNFIKFLTSFGKRFCIKSQNFSFFVVNSLSKKTHTRYAVIIFASILAIHIAYSYFVLFLVLLSIIGIVAYECFIPYFCKIFSKKTYHHTLPECLCAALSSLHILMISLIGSRPNGKTWSAMIVFLCILHVFIKSRICAIINRKKLNSVLPKNREILLLILRLSIFYAGTLIMLFFMTPNTYNVKSYIAFCVVFASFITLSLNVGDLMADYAISNSEQYLKSRYVYSIRTFFLLLFSSICFGIFTQ